MVSCDFCPLIFHLDCLHPPLTIPPSSVWMCPVHPNTKIVSKHVVYSSQQNHNLLALKTLHVTWTSRSVLEQLQLFHLSPDTTINLRFWCRDWRESQLLMSPNSKKPHKKTSRARKSSCWSLCGLAYFAPLSLSCITMALACCIWCVHMLRGCHSNWFSVCLAGLSRDQLSRSRPTWILFEVHLYWV